MKISSFRQLVVFAFTLVPSFIAAQQLFEAWVPDAEVGVPQVNGVAAWADMHGNSYDYDVIFNEYRQDLAVSGRDSAGNIVTAIYWTTNISPYYGVFTPPSADPASVSFSQNLSPAIDGRSIAWCDYNNDGFPDLAVAGLTAEGAGRVVLYRNQGRAGAVAIPYRELVEDAVTTTALNAGLPGTSGILWLDYDNDGKTDLLTSGIPLGGNNHVIRMFHNTGGGFTRDPDAESVLPQGMEIHSMRAADFDLDSDLDLLVSDSGGNVSVFNNLGNGEFGLFAQPCRIAGELDEAALPGKSAWVDLNGDRYPDIVMAGRTSSASPGPAMRYAMNVQAPGGGRSFANPIGIVDAIGSGSTPSRMVQLEIGDMNHDGYADIVVAGYDAGDTPAFRIYRPSVAPDGSVSVSVDPQSASYQPHAAGSSPSDVGGLVSGGSWSHLSMGHFNSVPIGATVSSLDVLLMGASNGSPVGSLLCNPSADNLDTPEPIVLGLGASMTKDGAIRFQWEPSAAEAAKSRTHGLRVRRFIDDPVDSHYDVSPGSRSVFGHGNGGMHFTTLPQPGNAGGANFWDWKHHGLVPGDRINWEVFAFNSRYNISHYNNPTGSAPFRVPYLVPTAGFPQEIANRIGRYGGSAWADIDGDGDVDGIVGGSVNTRLWINIGNGNFVFPMNPANIEVGGRYEWGDVNGDGSLDLLVALKPGIVGGIYRNLGGQNAAIQFAPFEPFDVSCYEAKFADCDKDGDLDVAVLRVNDYPAILFNDGPTSAEDPLGQRRWSVKNGPGPIIYGSQNDSSLSWADIDNDGRPDLLVSVSHELLNTQTATLYRNAGMLADGSVDFQPVLAPDLPQALAPLPAWGDIDRDGYLDLFIGGKDYTQRDDEGSHAVLLNRPDGSGGRTFVRATGEGVGDARFNGQNVTEENGKCESLWVDMNNDGWLDLVARNNLTTSVYLSEMDGEVRTLVKAIPLSSGNHADPADPAAPSLPGDLSAGDAVGLAAMDADGDGRMDLLIGTLGGGNTGYAIYRNNFNVAPLLAPTAPASIQGEYDAPNQTLNLDWAASPDANHYNLLVRDTAGAAADLPLQTGPQPGRWPVSGQEWSLSGFRPMLGHSYLIGVQSVNQNRKVSSLTSAEIRFPTNLVGNVDYVAPAWALLERRLGSPAGLRVYADLNANAVWDGAALEPSDVTDENGAYRIPLEAPGLIQVRIDGLCPNGAVITSPAPVLVAADDGGRDIPVGEFEVTDAYEVEVAVFYDRDRDGVRDAGEELMEDWPLTLDADGNGVIDAGEESHESGGIFTCLADPALLQPGGVPNLSFVLSRAPLAPPPQDWLVILQNAGGPLEHTYQFPLGLPEVLALDEARHIRLPAAPGFRVALEVGVWSSPRTVYGHVIHDENANAAWDLSAGEMGLENWEVLMDFNNDGILDPELGEMTATTSGGSFIFHPVSPGRDYQVSVRKPDDTWVQSFPSDEAVPVSVGADNIIGVDFGFFQPDGLVDAPANQAEAMTDADGNGAPEVMDYLFGRAVKGQPLQGLRLSPASVLLGRNPALPVRTNGSYPVLSFRVRPASTGITFAVHASSSLDGEPSKELAWQEVSSRTTPDGMIEREIVILPALPTAVFPRVPDPLGEPPARAFMRIHIDFSALPPGPTPVP